MTLGFGVLINMLGSNRESVAAVEAATNKTIISLKLEDNRLKFEFADGSRLTLWDDGQSCCESRYMRTDDDLQDYIGSIFLGVEVRDGGTTEDEHDDLHEIAFLYIRTNQGMFTLANHNEHNGYYGGFAINASAD